MLRWLSLVSLVLTVAACGGGNDDGNPADSTATRVAALSEIATIQAGEWTATPLATASPSPSATPVPDQPSATPQPTPTATAEPTTTSTTTPTAEPMPEDLSALLPTLAEMPAGYAVTEEGTRSAAELAAEWNDPNAILDALDGWGWRANAFRNFAIPSPGFNDVFERMIGMNSSISQYGSDDQAQDAAESALQMLRDIEGIDLPAVSADQIGDLTIAAQGEVPSEDGTDTGIVALLYVVEGDVVYTFNGVSYRHNSLPDLIEIASKVLSRDG